MSEGGERERWGDERDRASGLCTDLTEFDLFAAVLFDVFGEITSDYYPELLHSNGLVGFAALS